MEATGRDGGRGPWSYREQAGSSSCTISSTLGTISTNGYTSTSSHLSWISMEAAMLSEEMGEEDTEGFVQPAVKKFRKETEVKHTELGRSRLRGMSIKEMKMERIKSLAKEFYGAPSAKWSIEGADMSVLEKWFKELGVGWVLHFADGAASGKLEQSTLNVSSWIRALTEIKDALSLTESLFPGHGSSVEEGPAATESEEEQDIMTDEVQIASFAQQAILKMLPSVDFIHVPNLNITCDGYFIHLFGPYHKLFAMILVHQTLFTGWSFPPLPSARLTRIQDNVVGLLSAKTRKVVEAVWNTMEEIRIGILQSVEDGDDSSDTQHPQGSPDIHKATKSLVSYLRFLGNNSLWVRPIISKVASLGKYVPQMDREEPDPLHSLLEFLGWEDSYPLHSLNAEMLSCVQEKLADKSEAFQDHSLRFLFLLNNSSFVRDQLSYIYLPESYKAAFSGKVEGYVESYIQVAWAPVLACLFNPKPLRLFGKKNSPLLKFESEFHKTYTTQKLWKVPDPQLRKTLREAIIEKIVPDYTKYIQDNKVTTPKFTPRNLEEMLQELFEG